MHDLSEKPNKNKMLIRQIVGREFGRNIHSIKQYRQGASPTVCWRKELSVIFPSQFETAIQ